MNEKEININIPYATEARRILDNGEYERAQNQAARIELEIKNAIAKGQNIISGDGRLENSLVKKLGQLGYKYKTYSQHNESSWIISW